MSVVGTQANPKDITGWWEWALSIPDQPSTPHVARGGNIFQNQNKPFFCLVCTFGTGRDLARQYTVRSQDLQKRIIVPVLTSEASTAENPGYDDQQLLTKAREDLKDPQVLFLNIDGTYILTPQNAAQYYVESNASPLTPVRDNILRLTASNIRMACIGYFVFLDPLTSGHHDITFGGSAGPTNDRIDTLVHYDITVP